jgi:hypothetical protein
MVVGLLLIALAVNFLLTVRGTSDPVFRIDPVGAAACGLAVIFVGGLLLLSTYGRFRKVRRAGPPPPP